MKTAIQNMNDATVSLLRAQAAIAEAVSLSEVGSLDPHEVNKMLNITTNAVLQTTAAKEALSGIKLS